MQDKFENEKEEWKVKVGRVESKLKLAEQRKSALLFEIEREKAKWNIEKEHLIQQKNELLEKIDHIERSKEKLLRDNERLKNQNKKNKKLLTNNFSSNL